MSKETMIIFVADFIEPERSHPKRVELMSLAQLNLDSPLRGLPSGSIEKLKRKMLPIHPLSFALLGLLYNINNELNWSPMKKWHFCKSLILNELFGICIMVVLIATS